MQTALPCLGYWDCVPSMIKATKVIHNVRLCMKYVNRIVSALPTKPWHNLFPGETLLQGVETYKLAGNRTVDAEPGFTVQPYFGYLAHSTRDPLVLA